MNQLALEDLTQRLDRLERENRRLKRVGAAVAIGIAAIVLMGQASTAGRVVEAERFILRDAKGKLRAELHARHPSMGTVLDFYNENSRHVAVISETGLAFWSQSGTLYAVLEVVGDKGRLAFADTTNQQTRAELSVQPDGTPLLRLADRDGKVRAGLVLTSNGEPSLALAAKDGKTRAVLGMMSDDEPRLELADKNGTPRATLGSVSLETASTGVIERLPASSLVLFGEDGKSIWRAP